MNFLKDRIKTWINERRQPSQLIKRVTTDTKITKSEVDTINVDPVGRRGQPYTFVSYARKDYDRVHQICNELRGMGANLWLDIRDIEAGDSFVTRLREGLDGCANVMPFCSIDHSFSKWCQKEVFYAAEKIGRPIIPVWLTDPALYGNMNFLLCDCQAILVDGLPAQRAAAKIQPNLWKGKSI